MDERETRRSGYPLTIPEALLNSQAMQGACAARDFQEIFRLVNRRTGSSYAVMAAAVGKMTSSRVSDIIRGVRGIRGQEVIARVADGFGIPGDMLGLLKRPWEGYPEGSDGIRNARTTVGVVTDPEGAAQGDTSGDVSPTRGGFAATALTVDASIEEFRRIDAALDGPRGYFDGAVADYFRSQLDKAKCDDGALGPKRTLPVVLGLLGAVEGRARDVAPRVRRELLAVGAEGAEFAGWLYRDMQQPQAAVFWYDRAMEWAQEADDAAMQGYVLLKKSQMAYDERDALRMLTLAEAAGNARWRLPVRVRAEVAQQEALGRAMLGDPLDAVRGKLDTAQSLLASVPEGEPSSLGAYFTEYTRQLRDAITYTEAGKPSLAIDLFSDVLSTGSLSRRDTGFFNARRAAALALSGEPDEAANVGKTSAEVALEVKSDRTVRVLGDVLLILDRWRSRPAVREFRDSLTS